jgi:hypothetical protein
VAKGRRILFASAALHGNAIRNDGQNARTDFGRTTPLRSLKFRT